MQSKSKVKPLVAEYAISLRKEGKTYREIVGLCAEIDPTESITLDWCKRNLSEVEKQKPTTFQQQEELCLKQITMLAVLPKGVTSTECKRIIKHNHKLTASDEVVKLYKKYKNRVSANNPDAFFRPSSLQPDRAMSSFKDVLASGNYLYDTIADHVYNICREYPEVYSSAVRRELASIIFPELQLMGGGANRMAYLEKAVVTLEDRVPQQKESCVAHRTPLFYVEEDELPY